MSTRAAILVSALLGSFPLTTGAASAAGFAAKATAKAAQPELSWLIKTVLALQTDVTALQGKVGHLEKENERLKVVVGLTNLNANLGDKSLRGAQADLESALAATEKKLASTKETVKALRERFVSHTHGYTYTDKVNFMMVVADSPNGSNKSSVECSKILGQRQHESQTSQPSAAK